MREALQITQNRVFKAQITVMNSDDYYTLGDGEKIAFGVKKHLTDTNYAIYKELTSANIASDNHSYTLILTSSDTNLAYGDYYFDIALVKANGQLHRIIECSPLVIGKAVVRSD